MSQLHSNSPGSKSKWSARLTMAEDKLTSLLHKATKVLTARQDQRRKSGSSGPDSNQRSAGTQRTSTPTPSSSSGPTTRQTMPPPRTPQTPTSPRAPQL